MRSLTFPGQRTKPPLHDPHHDLRLALRQAFHLLDLRYYIFLVNIFPALAGGDFQED